MSLYVFKRVRLFECAVATSKNGCRFPCIPVTTLQENLMTALAKVRFKPSKPGESNQSVKNLPVWTLAAFRRVAAACNLALPSLFGERCQVFRIYGTPVRTLRKASSKPYARDWASSQTEMWVDWGLLREDRFQRQTGAGLTRLARPCGQTLGPLGKVLRAFLVGAKEGSLHQTFYCTHIGVLLGEIDGPGG